MKEDNKITIYIKKQNYNGGNKPEVRQVEVADSGQYWMVVIPTNDNPTFEIDQIG